MEYIQLDGYRKKEDKNSRTEVSRIYKLRIAEFALSWFDTEEEQS